jgi:probable HAF family extracellular repeat protein
MQDMGTLLGGTQSVAYGINNNGQVVGSSSEGGPIITHPFLWTATDGMHDLGTLFGGISSVAYGINDTGQVVGSSYMGLGITHSFLWSSGGMQDLGIILGGTFSVARSINDNGKVVGISNTALGENHAVLWINVVSAKDTTPPVITLYGLNPVSITIGTRYIDAGATAVDTVDPFVLLVTTGSVDTSVVGTYTITYTATDMSGNTAILTRTVYVVAGSCEENDKHNSGRDKGEHHTGKKPTKKCKQN